MLVDVREDKMGWIALRTLCSYTLLSRASTACQNQAANRQHPCVTMKNVMEAQNPSKQTLMHFATSQIPKIVAATICSNSLCCLFAADICLLMVQEHGQPRAACTLQMPQADVPMVSGAQILCGNGSKHLALALV